MIAKHKGLLLFAFLLITTFLSTIIFPFIYMTIGIEEKMSLYMKILLGQLFGYVLPLTVLLSISKKTSNVGFSKTSIFNIKKYINKKINIYPVYLLTIIFYFFIHFLVEGISNLYIFFTSDFSNIITNSNAPLNSFVSLVVIFAIVPAIIEEITYRGLYYDAFNRNKFLLFFVSVIVFTFSHGSIFSAISALLLGIFLMLIMNLTENLKVVIILHFLYNFLSLIFSNYIKTPFISPSEFIDMTDQPQVILGASFLNFSISLFFLIFVILFYYRVRDKIRIKSTILYEEKKPYKKLDYIFAFLLCLSITIIFAFRIF